MSREIITSNFMEALLRTALILGEREPQSPVIKVCISSFEMQGRERRLRPQCWVTMAPKEECAAPAARLLVLYPEPRHRTS